MFKPILYSKYKKEEEGEKKRKEEIDQNTVFTGVPPILLTQLQIQTGVSAPTASGGGAVSGPYAGPWLCGTKFEILNLYVC